MYYYLYSNTISILNCICLLQFWGGGQVPAVTRCLRHYWAGKMSSTTD